MINLNHLLIFHSVAMTGNVSRAAERLMVSQPAISKQLRTLERSLGTALFDRLPRGMRLTSAGEVLAGHARRLFAVEAEAEQAMRELRGLRQGRLAIGASTTIGIYLLPQLFARFRRAHPGIEVRLEIENTDHIQAQLADNLLDLALTEGFVDEPSLRAEVFMMDELVAIAPKDHPLVKARNVSAKRLCAEPFVLREAGSGTRAVVERAIAQRGLKINEVMALASTEAIKRVVAEGVGVAIVSKLTIASEVDAGTLKVIPLADLTIPRPLHLVRLRGKDQSVAADAFARMLSGTRVMNDKKETAPGHESRVLSPRTGSRLNAR